MRIEQDLFLVPIGVLRDIYETGLRIGQKPENERYSYSRCLETLMEDNLNEGYVTKLKLKLTMDK